MPDKHWETNLCYFTLSMFWMFLYIFFLFLFVFVFIVHLSNHFFSFFLFFYFIRMARFSARKTFPRKSLNKKQPQHKKILHLLTMVRENKYIYGESLKELKKILNNVLDSSLLKTECRLECCNVVDTLVEMKSDDFFVTKDHLQLQDDLLSLFLCIDLSQKSFNSQSISTNKVSSVEKVSFSNQNSLSKWVQLT